MAEGYYFSKIHWRKSKGQFQWRIVGGNGEPVAPGERYTRKSTMLGMIEQVKKCLKYPIEVEQRNADWSIKKKV